MGKLIIIALIAIAGWMFFKPPPDAGTVRLASVSTSVEQAQTPPRDIALLPVPDKVTTTTPAPDTATSGEQSYTQGLWVGALAAIGAVFAGGWFVAGLGLGAWVLLGILFCIPATAIGILSEYSDSRIKWFWRDSKRGQRERIDTHEFVTTLIFVATLALLNYGGLPVWATLMSWKAVPAIAIWLVIGFLWSRHRWDDFSAFLHELFTETKSQLALNLKSNIDTLLMLRKDFREAARLEDGAELPTNAVQMGMLSAQDVRHELQRISEREGNIRAVLAKTDGDEVVQLSDDNLRYWSEQLGRSTPEKTVLVPEFSDHIIAEATKLSPTSKDAHKGQLFLWVFFWPFSFALRAIRKIVTLRILHDLFNAFLKRFGFFYDRIEAANKIEDEVVARRGGTPTPTAPAEAPKLREVGKD